MKKFLSLIVAGSITFIFAIDATAQDFWKTDPSFAKVLVDTTLLNAAVVTFEPGKKTNMHTHSAFFAYVLSPGTLLVEYADGTTQTIEFGEGDYAFADAEPPHRTVNTGSKAIKMLMVELKEHPYKARKRKNKNR